MVLSALIPPAALAPWNWAFPQPMLLLHGVTFEIYLAPFVLVLNQRNVVVTNVALLLYYCRRL